MTYCTYEGESNGKKYIFLLSPSTVMFALRMVLSRREKDERFRFAVYVLALAALAGLA